jgi:hypothetical protein
LGGYYQFHFFVAGGLREGAARRGQGADKRRRRQKAAFGMHGELPQRENIFRSALMARSAANLR